MTRKKVLGLFGFLLVILGIIVFINAFLFNNSGPVVGALQVSSVPKMDLFIDGNKVGQTPFTLEKIKPGEYNVKLGTWELKAKVNAGTLTYISRESRIPEEKSSWQILTLEKLPTQKFSDLSVVSDPDNAAVIIDGLEKARTPTVLKNLSAGDHTVVVSQGGYSDQIIQGRLISGFRLNVSVKLGRIDAPAPLNVDVQEKLATASAGVKQVEIKITPVGYLRVRAKPDANAIEIGRVLPKEKYEIVSQEADWVQIKIKNTTGWVSKDYVTIL